MHLCHLGFDAVEHLDSHFKPQPNVVWIQFANSFMLFSLPKINLDTISICQKWIRSGSLNLKTLKSFASLATQDRVKPVLL